jgi:hypothetical protein
MSRLLAMALCFALSACQAKATGPTEWSESYYTWTPPRDWSDSESVSLDLENVSTESFQLSVEIRDSQSRDYWSRSNLSFNLRPGRQKISFPTRLYAGESLRPGRALDSRNIVSVILARGDAQEGRLIRLHALGLEAGLKLSKRGIQAFDFGPVGSSVMPGFGDVSAEHLYTPQRGYGWVGAKFWSPYARACWVSGPDSLSEDCLMPYAGDFRLDLPAGVYEVALGVDHPGPFWGEFPSWERRRVLVNGKAVLDEGDDAAQSLKRYFKSEQLLPRNADELAQHFGPGRVPLRRFDVNHPGGPLLINFENKGCPDRPCFGLAVSALLVAPQGKLSPFLSELDGLRRAEFAQRFRWNPSASATAPVEKLSELVASIGERDQALAEFRFARAAQDLRLVVHSANPQVVKSLSASWVQPRVRRLDPLGTSVGRVDDLVVPVSSASADAGQSLRALLEWKPEALAASSRHEAELRVLGSQGEVLATQSVSLRVRSKSLAPVPFAVGPFGHEILERWWPQIESTPRLQSLKRQSLDLMRLVGLTGFSFEPRIVAKAKGFDFSEMNGVMEEARARGFVAVLGYGSVFRDEDACHSKRSAADWSRLFAQLEEESLRKNWLPLTIVMCDEPEGDELERVLKWVESLPRLPAKARVRWSVSTHTEKGTSSEHRALARKLPTPLLADFETSDLKGPWIFYNNLSRWNFGYRTWALSEARGLEARYAWTWNQNAADPFNPLDAREDDYRWCTSLASGQLACTLEFYQKVSRGVQDIRRALSLRRVANDSKGPRRLEAQKLLNEILSKVESKSVDDSALEAWTLRAEGILRESGF